MVGYPRGTKHGTKIPQATSPKKLHLLKRPDFLLQVTQKLFVSPETLIQSFTHGKFYMEVAWGIRFLWYIPLRYLTKYHYDYESIQLALLFGLCKIVLVSPETLIQVLTIKSFLVG